MEKWKEADQHRCELNQGQHLDILMIKGRHEKTLKESRLIQGMFNVEFGADDSFIESYRGDTPLIIWG